MTVFIVIKKCVTDNSYFEKVIDDDGEINLADHHERNLPFHRKKLIETSEKLINIQFLEYQTFHCVLYL